MKYDKFKELVEHGKKPVVTEYISSAEDMMDYEKIRPNVFYRVVSGNEKEKLEGRCPYISFFDMAITFRWLFHEDEEGISSALIEYKHMEYWEIDEDTLILTAIRNTPRLFAERHCRILEAINHWTSIDGPDLPLYIFTNRIGINGASVMFYSDVLRTFADELGQDLYILPSSIHEVLVIGKEEVTSVRDLQDMVWEANHTVVTSKEFLSNQVMYYNRITDEIEMVP
jgi:hypothetical protein